MAWRWRKKNSDREYIPQGVHQKVKLNNEMLTSRQKDSDGHSGDKNPNKRLNNLTVTNEMVTLDQRDNDRTMADGNQGNAKKHKKED